MKAIVLNAGSKAVVVRSLPNGTMRYEAISFRTSMRFPCPAWAYREEGDKLVLTSAALSMYVDQKDTGISYT